MASEVAPNGIINVNNNRKKKMTAERRKEVASYFQIHSSIGPNGLLLRHGMLIGAAKEFNISRKHAGSLWKQGKKKYEETGSFTLTPDHGGGRPQKYDADTMRDTIREMHPLKKKSLRSIASELGIDHVTLRRYKIRAADDDDPIILPHSNPIKPELTPEHEVARVLYCRCRLLGNRYISMYNEVHVDEKWFFLSEEQLQMYITPGEKVPRRTTPHKSHILKVMFLCAVARPRFDDDGNCTFDGKLGLWPFLVTEVAQRSSVNRPAGTEEQKPVTVNTPRYRNFLITKVLPAIRSKWPERTGRNAYKVTIQQDGAPSHIKEDDPAFVEAATKYGWKIKLVTQPARSPDLNILDLGFFRSLQTQYWGIGFARTVQELMANVYKAFQDYDPITLDKIWVTSSTILDEIILCNGGNEYKIPHMNKDKIIREKGRLPKRVTASDPAIKRIKELKEEEAAMELDILAVELERWEKEERHQQRLAAQEERWQREEERELKELEELLEQEELADVLREAEALEEDAMMVDGEDIYS